MDEEGALIPPVDPIWALARI